MAFISETTELIAHLYHHYITGITVTTHNLELSRLNIYHRKSSVVENVLLADFARVRIDILIILTVGIELVL